MIARYRRQRFYPLWHAVQDRLILCTRRPVTKRHEKRSGDRVTCADCLRKLKEKTNVD